MVLQWKSRWRAARFRAAGATLDVSYGFVRFWKSMCMLSAAFRVFPILRLRQADIDPRRCRVRFVHEVRRGGGELGLDGLILLRGLTRRGSLDRWSAAELLQLPEGDAAARLVSLRERGDLAVRGRGRSTLYRLARRHADLVDAAVPTEDDVRVDEESVRLRLIALVIKEMNRDGEAVTVTNRARPVAVLSPMPASEETHSAFVGTTAGAGSLTLGGFHGKPHSRWERGYTNAAGGAVEQCPVKQGSAEDAAFIMKSAHTPCGEDWPPRFG